MSKSSIRSHTFSIFLYSDEGPGYRAQYLPEGLAVGAGDGAATGEALHAQAVLQAYDIRQPPSQLPCPTRQRLGLRACGAHLSGLSGTGENCSSARGCSRVGHVGMWEVVTAPLRFAKECDGERSSAEEGLG